jgi:deoxyribonuclease V
MSSVHDDVPGWDGTAGGANALRQSLAARVLLRDGFPKTLSTVAGFKWSVDGGNARAAVVVLDAADLSIVESRVAHLPASAPCESEPRAFRNVAALLAAFRMLPAPPDVALVEGDGIADPQRFGVASHFGVATGVPTIGVSLTALVGTASPLHQIRGAYTPLRDHGQQVGWLLRTQAQEEPLVVSPAHKVAMASAADLVMRFVTRHRLPEPLRLAEQMLSDSDAI